MFSVDIAQVYDVTKTKLIAFQHFTKTWRKLPDILREHQVNETICLGSIQRAETITEAYFHTFKIWPIRLSVLYPTTQIIEVLFAFGRVINEHILFFFYLS